MCKKFTIIRTIHPVGQGAFYTEEYFSSNFYRVVFDCGSKTKIGKSNCIQKVIQDSFQVSNVIDILFISHFDKDHVNGIDYLLNNDKLQIKYVVMPQIDDYKWFCITENTFAYSEELGQEKEEEDKDEEDPISKIVSKCKDKKIKIIQVSPINDDDNFNPPSPEAEEVNPISHYADKNKGIIKSGTSFGLVGNPFWIYIPINYTYDRDIKDLKAKIQKILETDSDYKGKEIQKLEGDEVCEFIRKHKGEINKVYNAVFPNTNASSLCVYSGMIPSMRRVSINNYDFINSDLLCYHFLRGICPEDIMYFKCREEFFKYYKECLRYKEGCLYTGDSAMAGEANAGKIQCILKAIGFYIDRIGLFQLPHHGSKANFDRKVMTALFKNDYPLIYFASFGSSNPYGHPSDCIIKLINSHYMFFHGVTEAKCSTLRQNIEIWEI